MEPNLPSAPPPSSTRLRAEEWERYRDELEAWSAHWDASDREFFRDVPSRSDDTFKKHPMYKGQQQWDVLGDLKREARQNQLLYKLAAAWPGTLSAEHRLAVEVVRTKWHIFGSGIWREMKYPEL